MSAEKKRQASDKQSEEIEHKGHICAHESCIVSSLRGLRNGIFYGARVRFMHAFVMSILFKKAGPREVLTEVLQLTWEHAKNLGSFVLLYKSLVCVLNRIRGRRSRLHNFLAGAIIGLLIFGKKTNVNQQIVLYLFSRVTIGAITNLMSRGAIPKVDFFPYLASSVWGLVMFLFEEDKNNLQPSLAGSMQFLYKDSDKKLTSLKQLVPLEVPTIVERFLSSSEF